MKRLKQVSIAIMFALILSLITPSIIPAFMTVTSIEAATTVNINKKKVTLYVGQTCKLHISGASKTVKWSSSDNSVATVTSKGKVTAKKEGTTTITAIVNKKEYTCKVTVKAVIQITPTGGAQPDDTEEESSTVNTGIGAHNLIKSEVIFGGTYAGTKADENAIRAENSIIASLSDVTVIKNTGATSSSDASSFYGLNAAILALGGSTLNISGSSVTACADGANGVFAYDGATINITNSTINVSGDNAGGIEVAGGGIMNATNLIVNSLAKAAIRSDLGGGIMTVNGGIYTTSGSSGAPAIYSTANITVNNATLTAKNSEAIVMEGLNSVTLNNCTVTGNMSGTYGASGGENIHNVMLYQSMSSDAKVGKSSFTMLGGSLTSKSGDMFYVTNTDCTIDLNNVALTLSGNIYTKLLAVAGNDASKGWGTVGSNGGDCTFTVSKQTLEGNISVDEISKLAMTIEDSSFFSGSINSDGTNALSLSVTIDASSTWSLTEDCYVTEFKGRMSSLVMNGHTLYVNGVAKN